MTIPSIHALRCAEELTPDDIYARNANVERAARWIQEAIDMAIAEHVKALFASMPVPPDDMASPDGLEAYAEATLQWRKDKGFPV